MPATDKPFRKLLLTWLLLVQTTCLWAGSVRVLCLNAEWFPGRAPDPSGPQQARHLVAMQQMLYDINPDVWLVQEVNRAEALPIAYSVLPDYQLYAVSDFTDGPHQLAIAGRLPLQQADMQRWPMVGDQAEPPRGIGYAAVTLPDTRVLLVFTLHMKSNYRGSEEYDPDQNVAIREAEAHLAIAYINDRIDQLPAGSLYGVLVGGDFNVLYPHSLFRGERTVRFFKEAGFEMLGRNGLDHFWGLGLSNTLFRVVTEHAVSDHHGILLTVPLEEGLSMKRAQRIDPAVVREIAGDMRSEINTASYAELQALPGIGPVLAERIAELRPFDSVEELVNVCGIGPVRLELMQPFIKVGTEAMDQAEAQPVHPSQQ